MQQALPNAIRNLMVNWSSTLEAILQMWRINHLVIHLDTKESHIMIYKTDKN